MFMKIAATVLAASTVFAPHMGAGAHMATAESTIRPNVVMVLSKADCDRKYDRAVKVCKTLPAAWRRRVCYEGAMSSYAECLTAASYQGGSGGGSMGGRSRVPVLVPA